MARCNRVSSTFFFLAFLTANLAQAQDGSWLWPLYVAAPSGNFATGEPRPAVWGSAGEFQKFGSSLYMHPGHDIRGNFGDVVLAPANGTVEQVYLDHDECRINPNSCRVWVQEEGGRFLYYFSHVSWESSATPGVNEIPTEFREALEAARAPSSANRSERQVTRGQPMGVLTMFNSDVQGWHHLHVGIFDSASSYQMANTISFFDLDAEGSTGERLYALDDEPPVIADLALTFDDSPVLTSAVSAGVCGDEISGPVDIVGDIYDTYYTTGRFANFPGKSTLNPNSGIRAARYFIKNQQGQIVREGEWFDIDGLPITCSAADTNNACLLPNTENTTSLAQFFARMRNEDGGPSVGTTLISHLFNTQMSMSDYTVRDGERYFHILTNENGVPGVWNPGGLPNGRYQVTAVAEDFSFRSSSRSRFINVRQPGTSLGSGLGDVYVRDRAGDIGAVPSNAGGEPFWESPDIFVVPAGTSVNVGSLAVQSQVVAGSEYDVYVRIHNDTCENVSGVRARVVSADPAAINVNWLPITSGGGFVGTEAHPSGISVPPQSAALLGPYRWVPTEAEAALDGHRCLLAGISASADELSLPQLFDAPGHNNVAQRNVSITGCLFQLPNPNPSSTEVSLRVTTDAEVENGSLVELVTPFVPSWYQRWVNIPGVEVSGNAQEIRVRLRVRDITLPSVSLLPGAVQQLSFNISLPQGERHKSATISPSIAGAAVGGFSCYGDGGSDIR